MAFKVIDVRQAGRARRGEFDVDVWAVRDLGAGRGRRVGDTKTAAFRREWKKQVLTKKKLSIGSSFR